MPKFQLHMAAVRNFIGIFQRFGTITKALRHLVVAFEIKAIVRKAHAVRLIHGTGRLDAQQNVLRGRILSPHIVQVVGGHES